MFEVNNVRVFLRMSGCFLLLALCAANVHAAINNNLKLAAKAYILQDFNSGRIIAEHNADKTVEPASLTKMMSTYVVEQELKLGNVTLTDMVKVSKKAWSMGGSRMFIEVGSTVSVKDLLMGVIVQSGNDATIALAEHVAGTEDAFVALMNEYARMLGMKETNFVNATGMPHKDHRTTAKDLAILVGALVRDFPETYEWYSIKEFTFNGIKQYNRNKLLWQDKYVDGVKTGHTDSAGFCLAASAVRGDMRLISVVLGTKSESARATESQKLLTYGFRFFETYKLYAASEPLTTARVWKGQAERISLGLAEDLYVTIPRGSYDKLKATMSIDAKIIAPAHKGRIYGQVNISLDKEPYLNRELTALSDVQEGGLITSILDEVQLLFE
ncbi:MAG: D-alanyl-D-alanine carboxypeptidase [Gammaproteobacteria bacterium]|nr:D-alanyl-D-alanine carboxypeptidase [Gammaproteobacteria bacterium]